MCDRGASYVVKQMVRCGIAVASDCAVHTMMKEKILWMKGEVHTSLVNIAYSGASTRNNIY